MKIRPAAWFLWLRAEFAQALTPEYGTCLCCRMPWGGPLGVKHHFTDFGETTSCFALCESCWTKLGTPERRMPYYRDLVRYWDSNGNPESPEIVAEIYQAVRDGK